MRGPQRGRASRGGVPDNAFEVRLTAGRLAQMSGGSHETLVIEPRCLIHLREAIMKLAAFLALATIVGAGAALAQTTTPPPAGGVQTATMAQTPPGGVQTAPQS